MGIIGTFLQSPFVNRVRVQLGGHHNVFAREIFQAVLAEQEPVSYRRHEIRRSFESAQSRQVPAFLKKDNVYRKEGDDYPPRIYIVFECDSGRLGFSEKVKYEIAKMLYGEYSPLASINYIWSSNAPLGSVVPNPYTDLSMMMVVQSGKKNLNTWVHFSILEDK